MKEEREKERGREKKQQSRQSGKPLIQTRVDSCTSRLKVEHVTSLLICSVRQRGCFEMPGGCFICTTLFEASPAQLTCAVEETCLKFAGKVSWFLATK
jgi:hypothetical protein